MIRKRKKIEKKYELIFRRTIGTDIRCNRCSLYLGSCPNLRIAFECDKVNGGSLSFNRIQYVV